jgi:hypothetical protein
MASLIIAALPVQTAATVLQAVTNRSPIRAAYTAVVEDHWPPRHLLDASLKWRSRRSFCRGTIGEKLESTVRYLGIEVDDALVISEQVELKPQTSGAAVA